MSGVRAGWPEGYEPAVPFERTFDALYGLEFVGEDVAGAGVVHGRIVVGEGVLDRHGAVHGGVFAAAAEALASSGTALTVIPHGSAAMGLSNDTTVLRRVEAGELAFEGRVVSRTEDAWVWTVDARDGEGRPCSHSRVTVAVRAIRR